LGDPSSIALAQLRDKVQGQRFKKGAGAMGMYSASREWPAAFAVSSSLVMRAFSE